MQPLPLTLRGLRKSLNPAGFLAHAFVANKRQPTPVFLPGEFHGQRAWWDKSHVVAKNGHD